MPYKWCLVPACTSTSLKTPEKLFVSVPKNEIRQRWLQLALRNPIDVMETANVFFCEDHFDMEKDVSNFHEYRMGLRNKIIMRDGVLPSKFECQRDIRKRLSDANTSQIVAAKRKKTKHGESEGVQITACEQKLVISEDHTSTDTVIKLEDMIDIEEHDVMANSEVGSLVMERCSVKHDMTEDEGQEDSKPNSKTEKKTVKKPWKQRRDSEAIFKSKWTHRLHINNVEKNGETDLPEPEMKKETPDTEVKEENIIPEDNFAPILTIDKKHSVHGAPKKNTSTNISQSKANKKVKKALNVNDFKGSLVRLEDWGPRLKDNPFFCPECGILFPTGNTFLAHNMSTHSLLIAIDEISTKSVSRINDNAVDTSKICNHCQVTFPDGETLIDHLYNIVYRHKKSGVGIDSKSSPPEKRNSSKSSPSEKQNSSKVAPDIENCSNVSPPENQREKNEDTQPHYYCCDICNCYFKFRDNITTHMSSNHSKVNIDLKTEPFTPKCRFCSNSFNSVRTYNLHIKINHKNEYWHEVTEESNDTVPPNDTEAKLNENKNTSKEKNVSSSSLTQKRQNSTNSTIEFCDDDKISKPSYYQELLLPKSVLFKCKKCLIHLINFSDVDWHSKVCRRNSITKGTWSWRCHICGRYLRLIDQQKHLLQHRLSSKLDVYLIEDDTRGRILNQCPDCETYLHESIFKTHCSTSCEGELVACTLCELDIHSSSLDEHYQCHYIMNRLGLTEIIIVKIAKFENFDIERAISESATPFSVKTETIKETSTKNPYLLKVYYCAKCGTYCMRARRGIHANGNCEADQRKSICNICGITTLAKYSTHSQFHKRFPKVTILDMQFLSIETDEPIAPPLPPFPKCIKCGIQYLRKATDKMHDCRSRHIKCKFCKQLFNGMAYRIHARYHKYASKMASQTDVTPKQTNPGRLLSHSTQSALLSKAVQIKENLASELLYRCLICNINFDSYDRTVEHCQKHYNGMETLGLVIKHCNICSLKFDSTCYQNHKSLHARNQTITRDSFQIITFNHSYLFLDSWLINLKAQFKDIYEIAASSTYFYTRRVKLRVVQDGEPGSTLFKCCKCEKFVHPASVTSHIRIDICVKDFPGCICKTCKRQFTTRIALKQHKLLHDKYEHFKIVYFNEEGDKTFNDKLSESDPTMTALAMACVSETNRIHYFKCNNCRLALGSRKLVREHKCGDAMMTRCNKCDLYFTVRGNYRPHKRLHMINPNFNRDLIEITDFIPKAKTKSNKAVIFTSKQKRKDDSNSKTIVIPLATENEDDNVEVYKCICGVHFISESTVEKHMEVCTQDDVPEEECEKCGRVFDATELEIHREHHSDSTKQLNVVLMKPQREMKRLLHHCKSCDLYFMSATTLNCHVKSGHPEATITNCSYCKLRFTSRSLMSHKIHHHEMSLQPKMQETQVSRKLNYTEKQLKNIVKKNKNYSNKLYKCKSCEAHFLTHSALYQHSRINVHFKDVHECDICQYTFSETTLGKHRFVHHENMKLKREDFNIATLRDLTVSASNDSDNENEGIDNSTTNYSGCTSHTVTKFSEEYLSKINLHSYSKKLYKCTICKAHFMRYGTLVVHLQRTHSKDVQKCELCGYGFNSTNIIKHRYIQHERMRLKREDFVIVTIESRKSKSDAETNIPEEAINDDIMSLHDVRTSIEDEHDSDRTSIGENNAEITAKENEENKNSNETSKEDQSQFLYTTLLFRCEKCDLNFIKLKTLENHRPRCIGLIRMTACHKCGLLFTRTTFSKHFAEHHVKLNLEIGDFKVMNHHGKIIKA